MHKDSGVPRSDIEKPSTSDGAVTEHAQAQGNMTSGLRSPFSSSSSDQGIHDYVTCGLPLSAGCNNKRLGHLTVTVDMPDSVNSDAVAKLFCLADRPMPHVPGWRTRAIGTRFLAYGPELPVHDIEIEGERGLLVGWPIFSAPNSQYDRQSLGDIGGRWAVITESYVLPDPLATYSMVYSAEHRIVAASPAVIPAELLRLDHPMNSALDLPNSDHWYPFGLTPWENLQRLLPNHKLDLSTFTATRETRDVILQDEDRALLNVSNNLRQSVEALAQSAPITILTTAGNDSRILLAAAKNAPKTKMLTFITASSATDVKVAKQLSRVTKLEHTTTEVGRDETDERLWFANVGRCVAGASLRSAALKMNLPQDQQYLKGIGGEIGRRTNYYRPGDEGRVTISPEALIQRLHLPNNPRLHLAAKTWLDGLTDYNDAAELIEIVYRENRIGAWASPQLHGDSINSAWLFPMNQQTTIDSLRFLSADTKNARTSPQVIINNLWPELLGIPINPLSLKEKSIKLAKRLRTKILPTKK